MMRIKSLIDSKTNSSGRNNQGKITIKHRGGGHKQKYIRIDFKKSIYNIPGVVLNILKDCNRSGNIALILYRNGVLSYNLAVKNLKIGDLIICGPLSSLDDGNSLPIRHIPLNLPVSSLEIKEGFGAKYGRSAGSSLKLINKYNIVKNKILILLNSKEEYLVDGNCLGTIGVVSNNTHRFKKLYKAGQSRWLNKRPCVRGVAMNPIDHPHGGGEGKTSGGRCSVSFTGKLTKGKPTRLKKIDKNIIYKRRKFKLRI